MKPLTKEQIDAVRHDARFTAERVGAPGSLVRQVAESTLQALDEREMLILAVKAGLIELKNNPPTTESGEVIHRLLKNAAAALGVES